MFDYLHNNDHKLTIVYHCQCTTGLNAYNIPEHTLKSFLLFTASEIPTRDGDGPIDLAISTKPVGETVQDEREDVVDSNAARVEPLSIQFFSCLLHRVHNLFFTLHLLIMLFVY